MSYFKSVNVEVFPSAWRTTYPNGKFTSESNFTNILNSLIDVSDGYVASYNEANQLLCVVIHGYYFEIGGVEVPTSDLWLSIHVGKNSEAIVPIDGTATYDDESSGDFTALDVSNTKPTTTSSDYTVYSLKAYDIETNSWNKFKFNTDSTAYLVGDIKRSLTDELDGKQYNLTAGNGITIESNEYDAANTIRLNDEEAAKLDSLEGKGNSLQLVYFDTNGKAVASASNLGGPNNSGLVYQGIYLKNGQLTLGKTITISSGDPTGGSAGDLWFKYSE